VFAILRQTSLETNDLFIHAESLSGLSALTFSLLVRQVFDISISAAHSVPNRLGALIDIFANQDLLDDARFFRHNCLFGYHLRPKS